MRWLDDRLRWLRDSMTPSQRWTAAIALGYVIAVLYFGAPDRVDIGGAPSRTQTRAAARLIERTAPTDELAALGGLPAAYGYLEADEPAAEPAVEQPSVTTPSDPATIATIAAVATMVDAPRVVALVRPAEPTSLRGRDDATIANAFLSVATFAAEVVAISPDSQAQCAQVADAGDVVIASEGVGPLGECLAARGVTVIAFDERGEVQADGGGEIVSTRRGIEPSLVDLARWGVRAGALRGKVGLVGSQTREADIGRAATTLQSLGVNLVATAYLAEGPASPVSVGDAARGFASKGVDVVVFATSASQQRQWVASYAVLMPGARYVVSDVADGVRDETYPPLFDGAVAHTSLRIPWFARDHGETPVQAACRQRWEARAGGAMESSEAVRVFAWCQHVALVDATLRAMDRTTAFDRALRGLVLASPLTADVRLLEDTTYGPGEDAVLEWRSQCACWRGRDAFAPRTARP